MYQAIVFLPLVGAILAGLITLVGAHARYPGGSPAPEGHDQRGPSRHDDTPRTITLPMVADMTAITRASRRPPAPARPS